MTCRLVVAGVFGSGCCRILANKRQWLQCFQTHLYTQTCFGGKETKKWCWRTIRVVSRWQVKNWPKKSKSDWIRESEGSRSDSIHSAAEGMGTEVTGSQVANEWNEQMMTSFASLVKSSTLMCHRNRHRKSADQSLLRTKNKTKKKKEKMTPDGESSVRMNDSSPSKHGH